MVIVHHPLHGLDYLAELVGIIIMVLQPALKIVELLFGPVDPLAIFGHWERLILHAIEIPSHSLKQVPPIKPIFAMIPVAIMILSEGGQPKH